MKNLPVIAIVGATGAVGEELMLLLEERKFPLASLRCLASSRSKGTTLTFRGDKVSVELLDETSLDGVDIAFFAASSAVSKKYAPKAARQGTLVIDKSSAFRMDSSVPLVIPEINPHALREHAGIIACPNCTTAIMLMVLAPLHRHFGAKRIVVSTYQAISGAGTRAVQELLEESRAFLEQKPYSRTIFPFPAAFNVFPHDSSLSDNGYVEEELKIVEESHKILEDSSIRISATCVRVPTLRAHAESVNIEFESSVTVEEAYAVLRGSPGISLLESRQDNRFATPSDASHQDQVFYGRIRQDLSHARALELWIVGDQLRKGAALNALQIAERVYI